MESLTGTWKATLSVLKDMENSLLYGKYGKLVAKSQHLFFVVDSNLAVG